MTGRVTGKCVPAVYSIGQVKNTFRFCVFESERPKQRISVQGLPERDLTDVYLER